MSSFTMKSALELSDIRFELDNGRRIRVLDAIDKRRELGTHEDVTLPRLVAVGDQSSKRLSLLEHLTGLPFASASDLCTRFATQVVLRRAPASETSVSISIIPGAAANADNEIKKKLVGFGIFCKQTSKWKTISEAYLTKVLDAVTDYNDSALKEFVIDNDIRRKLPSLIEENAQVMLEEAITELNSILQTEQGGPGNLGPAVQRKTAIYTL